MFAGRGGFLQAFLSEFMGRTGTPGFHAAVVLLTPNMAMAIDTERPVWAALSAARGPAFDSEAFVRSLQVDPGRREEIAAYDQRSVRWKEQRFGRLTSSKFGAAAGHHLPGSAQKVLQEMLWPEEQELKGRAAAFAEWGTTMENVARDLYVAYRRQQLGPDLAKFLRVTETGLLVSLECGWLAASPDFVVDEPVPVDGSGDDAPPTFADDEGSDAAMATETTADTKPRNVYHARPPYIIDHVRESALFVQPSATAGARADDGDLPPTVRMVRGCGEIKCPATKVLYSVTGKHDEHQFPKHYYDQIQGTMAINGWPWCDTVVYTPLQTEVIRFYFHSKYWMEDLLPALRAFYFKTFLPRLVLRAQGRLRPGETDPVLAPLKPLTLAALAAACGRPAGTAKETRAAPTKKSAKRQSSSAGAVDGPEPRPRSGKRSAPEPGPPDEDALYYACVKTFAAQ
jgi:hypothetical protein